MDPVVAYVRADLHVEAVEGPAGGVNGDIILGAQADEAGLVARDAIAVSDVPDLDGEGVFEVGIGKAGQSNVAVGLEFEDARGVEGIDPEIEGGIVFRLDLDMPGGVALDGFLAGQGDGFGFLVGQAILDLILDIERGANPETARVENEDRLSGPVCRWSCWGENCLFPNNR